MPIAYMYAARAVDEANGDRPAAIATLRQKAREYKTQIPTASNQNATLQFNRRMAEINEAAAKWLEEGKTAGHMYQVEIPPPTLDIKKYDDQAKALQKAKAQGHKVVTISGGELAVLDPTVIKLLKKYEYGGSVPGNDAISAALKLVRSYRHQ